MPALSRSLAAVAATALAASLSSVGAAAAAPAVRHSGSPDFGPNVRIFDPSMPASEIQGALDAAAAVQVPNQFGSQRYAFLFKPGSYDVSAQLGYYTSVAGLGMQPDDVTIHGEVHVEGQDQSDGTNNGLTNFWRSAENLAIRPAADGNGINWWAVSQAAPMRRVHVEGQLFLFPKSGGYVSGGFLADSKVDQLTINAGQQQWLTRESTINGWSNAVWNQVFSGVQGAPEQSFPDPPYTTLATAPTSQEKPFLYLDDAGRYRVFVPAVRHDAAGTSWADGTPEGRSIDLSRFFLAKPSDSAGRINAALRSGKNLLFTPGVYHLDRTLQVWRPGTVVLGLGFPTLIPERGVVPMKIASVPGVKLAGLLFDAGPVSSPELLQVGSPLARLLPAKFRRALSDPDDPTLLSDVFFRIGGAQAGKAKVSLTVNSDNVLLDDIWAWRADHGEGVGWTVNTADTGVVVNGDDVSAYGLFVEHYQKYQLIWNGERGRVVMFQNEMPYDAPNQAAWQHGSSLGYAAYKVSDSVRTHEAWGLGSYIYVNVDPSIHASRGFEVPMRPGVRLHDLLTVSLGAGTIDHVVNDTGAPVTAAQTGTPSYVVSYPSP